MVDSPSTETGDAMPPSLAAACDFDQDDFRAVLAATPRLARDAHAVVGPRRSGEDGPATGEALFALVLHCGARVGGSEESSDE